MGQVTQRVVKTADQNFTNGIRNLMQQQADQLQGELAVAASRFFEPRAGEFVNRLSQDDIHDKFDRSELSSSYTDLYKESGELGATCKEVIAVKLQHDWLAAAERAFHLRSRSRIRLAAHAAARTRSIGLDAGPVASGVDRVVGLLLSVEA